VYIATVIGIKILGYIVMCALQHVEGILYVHLKSITRRRNCFRVGGPDETDSAVIILSTSQPQAVLPTKLWFQHVLIFRSISSAVVKHHVAIRFFYTHFNPQIKSLIRLVAIFERDYYYHYYYYYFRRSGSKTVRGTDRECNRKRGGRIKKSFCKSFQCLR